MCRAQNPDSILEIKLEQSSHPDTSIRVLYIFANLRSPATFSMPSIISLCAPSYARCVPKISIGGRSLARSQVFQNTKGISESTPPNNLYNSSGLSVRTQAQSRTAPEISSSSNLEQALANAIALKKELDQGKATEEALTEMISEIETLSASLGMNQVFIDDNDGEFQGIPLMGQTAARLGAPLPLGLLSFGSYQPADLIVETLTDEEHADLTDHVKIAGVFKGKGYGQAQAYVLSTAFKIQNNPTIKGVSRAIGSYSIPEDESKGTDYMEISFHSMRLEPLTTTEEELQQWKDIFLPDNPKMDAKSGVLDVSLPAPAPGWQKYLLMGREYQLVMGNAGSKTLLKRIK